MLVILWIILLGIATIWIALRVHPVHRAEDELDDHGRERLCAANKHRTGNFTDAWARGNFSTTVFNSVVITLMKVPLGLLISAAAASLGLEPLLGRYPRQLSGGQRQRVAMGGAIVRDPKVFLFDEPLSNLDAKLRVQVRGEIKELQHRLKTTTIYLIHHQVEAMTMGYKIVVMNGGHVEQVGPPLELYDRPANTFVATFLGSPAMNLLPGRIEGEHSPQLSLQDGFAAAIDDGGRAFAGRDVIFGIRTEPVRVDQARGLPCIVSLVEPTGSETHVVAHAGQIEIIAVLRERVEIREGKTIRLSLDARQPRFFETSPGSRLSLA